MSFAAWDRTSGTAGSKVDTSVFGGTSAFSIGTAIPSITVDGVNDGLTISVTNSTPTFTENGGPVSLFSGTSIDPIESGELIDSLELTVDSLVDGSSEILVVDGQNIELTHLNNETTATSGYDVNVSVSATTATVVITKTGGFSALAAETLIDGLAYNNTSENPQGAVRLVNLISIKDNGGTAGGGVDTVGIGISSLVTISAINDDPTNTGSLPADVTVTEDVTGSVDLSTVTISDVDAGNNLITVTLTTSTGGRIWASSDFDVTVFGSGTGTLILNGGVADLNNFFSSATRFQYLHSIPHTNGDNADTIQVEINDGGNTGTGGGGTILLGTVNVDITPVNDAPSLSTSSPFIDILEDDFTNTGMLVSTYADLSNDADSGDANGIAITSVDDTNGIWQYTLDGIAWSDIGSVSTSGALLLPGDGVSRFRFVPTGDYAGSSGALNYKAWDQTSGAAGDYADVTSSGGSTAFSFGTNGAALNVIAVNDAPVVTAPGSALSATEQIATLIHGTGFSATDVDESNSGARASISVGEGNISITEGDSGVTIDAGNGTGSVTILGTIAQINNLLTGAGTGTITYLNTSDAPSSSTTISVTVNDSGNTGADPGLTGDAVSEEGTNSQTININPVNDPPVLAAIGDQSVNELATLNFTASATDVDAPANNSDIQPRCNLACRWNDYQCSHRRVYLDSD